MQFYTQKRHKVICVLFNYFFLIRAGKLLLKLLHIIRKIFNKSNRNFFTPYLPDVANSIDTM